MIDLLRRVWRRLRRVKPVIELIVGILGFTLAAVLAWDYLAGPTMREGVADAEPNRLVVTTKQELESIDVFLDLSLERERIIISLLPEDLVAPVEDILELRYETAEFGGGKDFVCTLGDQEVTLAANGLAATLVLWEVTDPDFNIFDQVECVRSTSLSIPDRGGEIYVFPTDVDVKSLANTWENPAPYQFQRSVNVPTYWTYDQDQSTIFWAASRESTAEGISSSSYDEQVFSTRILEPSNESRPMRFKDQEEVTNSERKAWASALVVGVAASIVTSGVRGLPGMIRDLLRRRA